MMSYQASSVPKWVADKLQSAITKNLTLPSCADIPLPYLLPVDHPEAGAALPGFLRALQGGAALHIMCCTTMGLCMRALCPAAHRRCRSGPGRMPEPSGTVV